MKFDHLGIKLDSSGGRIPYQQRLNHSLLFLARQEDSRLSMLTVWKCLFSTALSFQRFKRFLKDQQRQYSFSPPFLTLRLVWSSFMSHLEVLKCNIQTSHLRGRLELYCRLRETERRCFVLNISCRMRLWSRVVMEIHLSWSGRTLLIAEPSMRESLNQESDIFVCFSGK